MQRHKNIICTQIRVDRKLRHLVRLVCAAEKIENRKCFCQKAVEYFLDSNPKPLIAPARKGILFRVELPVEHKPTLDQLLVKQDTNMSRILHTAIYSYVENFKRSLSEPEQRLLARAYY